MIFQLATSDGKDAKLLALPPWCEGPCGKCRGKCVGNVVGNKFTHALFDCCARGLKFNRPLQPWTSFIEVDRNDDSVISFVPIVCDHVFLQHLSHGKDQCSLARIIYTVHVLYSHEVRIFWCLIWCFHTWFLYKWIDLYFRLSTLISFCNSCAHAYFLCPSSNLVSQQY